MSLSTFTRPSITSPIRQSIRSTLLRSTITTSHRTIVTSRPTFIASTPKMSSVITQAAQAAHSAFASLASYAEAKPGDSVPDVDVRINDLEDRVNFSKIDGKSILVLVPGAFSPTCSSQVPGYIERYADFQAKGVKDIYVVAVNDIFVVNAWKKSMAGTEGKDVQVKFVADDAATLASKLGLVLDAAAIFGGPRLKRGAVVIESGKVVSVAVEPNPGEVTVSHADEVIKAL